MISMFTVNLSAQRVDRNLPWDIWMNPTSNDFVTIQQEANIYFSGRNTGKGSGHKQWKRWEHFNSTRLTNSGKVTDPQVRAFNSFKQIKKSINSTNRSPNGYWTSWGATNVKMGGGWIPGIGRINTIEFHPTDANTLFVGTPAGGLWKTTNHGGDWTCLTNEIGSLGVSGIAIHPTSPNIMYILTGDGNAGSTRSIGVYKSTNGGTTWNTTGLSWQLSDNIRGYKLMMEPGDPTYLLVAATNGLWQTTDSGISWSMQQSGNFRDIEYKPGTSSIVYASTVTQIYKSTNWGGAWTLKQTISAANRVQLAVSETGASTVYAIAGGSLSPGQFTGFYRSIDSGETFSLRSTTPNIFNASLGGTGQTNQSWYDLSAVVHPIDSTRVLMGAINSWETFDSGTTWTQKTHWHKFIAEFSPLVNYMHGDIHNLKYNPNNGILYCANDGGIYFSSDNGTNWTDMTGGMNISQLHHFDGTEQDIDFMVGGLQDNGTSIFTGVDSMVNILGADGVDCVINPLNKNNIYAGTQQGSMRRSDDGGITFTNISPNGAGGPLVPFIQDFIMSPIDTSTLLLAWSGGDIRRTTNRGNNWSLIPVSDNTDIGGITYDPNGTTVYAISTNEVFKSFDSGLTWSSVFTISNGGAFTSIEPVFNGANECLVTRGGFGSDTKVYHIDGANTVTDLGGIFPLGVDPVPVNIIKSSPESPNILYIGTDMGVFQTNLSNFFDSNPNNDEWTMFHDLLPNVIVTDLYIYPEQELIRAATFGRGVWESSTLSECQHILNLTQANDPNNGVPGLSIEKADRSISSTRLIVGQNGDVFYGARDFIILKNGFRATTGNKVIVRLEDCIGNSSIE